MSHAAHVGNREDERVLSLDFECLRSIPEGINEVRVWRDNLLDCHRVGKRIDLSKVSVDDDVLPEPATLQSIDHINVVPVIAAARVGGFPQPMQVVELVTPYYPRGSVTDALRRGETFTASQAVVTTQAVLRGLGVLHERYGICHRDMKSGNVLLASDRTIAKVADLGLAGKFDTSGQVPAVQNPTLYSPSEILGVDLLTRASDIYPVGLMLRELLGGPFPYANYTTTATVERLLRGLCPIRTDDLALPPWASRSLRRIYRKATQRSPGARYQTAAAMDEALSRAVVVDWDSVGEARWEAPFVHSRKWIAVEAYTLRNGRVRLSTLVRGSGWRRTVPDVDVSDVDSTQAREVFDHANDIANAR